MEVATDLNNAIEKLKANKKNFQDKITDERKEVETLTVQKNNIANRIETLTHSLDKTESELLQLNTTIEDTEAGYQKLVEAGETLMSIVSQNLSNFTPNHIGNENHIGDENHIGNDNTGLLQAFKKS